MIIEVFKKVFAVIMVTVFLAPLLFFGNAYAQDAPKPIFGGDENVETGLGEIEKGLEKSGIAETGNVADLMLLYINFALPYFALAAFLGLVYAGFLYVTAYGNEEQSGKAKKIIMYVVIGIAVVILSRAIVDLFTSDLTGAINE